MFLLRVTYVCVYVLGLHSDFSCDMIFIVMFSDGVLSLFTFIFCFQLSTITVFTTNYMIRNLNVVCVCLLFHCW